MRLQQICDVINGTHSLKFEIVKQVAYVFYYEFLW
jgi:hypothetical protein